jgi:hypothetical protein
MHFFAIAAVLHTLIVAVLAFFVLFAASKSDGFVRLLGNVLGWILLIAAVLGLVFGIVHVMTGKGPMMMEGGGPHWMMHWEHGAPPPGAAPATTAQPAAPAQPATPATPPKKP